MPSGTSQPEVPQDGGTVVSTGQHVELTNRHYALLRAVAAGGCELTWSCEPDLFIGGLSCCDQTAAHLLAHNGLIQHSRPGRIGQRVPAQLTEAGRQVLASLDSTMADAA